MKEFKLELELKNSAINPPVEKTIKGNLVELKLSPTDVPVNVALSMEGECVAIEFFYLKGSREETVPFLEKDGIKIHLGTSSNRLYKIELPKDIVLSGEDNFEFSVSSAVDQLASEIRSSPKPGSFEAVKNSISSYGKEMIHYAVG